MENLTYVGEVAGNPIFKEQTASSFYMDKDGTVSTIADDGTEFKWDLSNNSITDENGKTSSFGSFLDGLGSTVNSFLDIVNKTAQTYENTTGSKIINTNSSSAQSGQLSSSDLNTLSGLINSSINQLKRNALYVGVGLAGIVAITVIMKKRAKARK